MVRDLGQRILARDLFKVIPSSSVRVNDFLRRDDAYERLYRVIGKHHPGAEKYYLIKDEARFKMLAEKKEEWGYFIDGDLQATPMREHDSIRPLWREPQESVRLFAPREAIEELHGLIG